MNIDDLVFSVPAYMKGPKRKLLTDIAPHHARTPADLEGAAALRVPVVDCGIPTRYLIERWASEKRDWLYRDRGYFRRGRYAASGLPQTKDEGYWRFHWNCYQLRRVFPADYARFEAMKIKVRKWQPGGRHVLICDGSRNYNEFHRCENWLRHAVEKVRRNTDRPVAVRHKGDRTPLAAAIRDAHCVVTHGSIAAVEAVILGKPVFVHSSSAAALVGLTDLCEIERPIYPARRDWLAALAASQVSEQEMRSGEAWEIIGRNRP